MTKNYLIDNFLNKINFNYKNVYDIKFNDLYSNNFYIVYYDKNKKDV